MTCLDVDHNLWDCFPLFIYKYPFRQLAIVTDETGEDHCGASPFKVMTSTFSLMLLGIAFLSKAFSSSAQT